MVNAKIYDYFEGQPTFNNRKMVDDLNVSQSLMVIRVQI